MPESLEEVELWLVCDAVEGRRVRFCEGGGGAGRVGFLPGPVFVFFAVGGGGGGLVGRFIGCRLVCVPCVEDVVPDD